MGQIRHKAINNFKQCRILGIHDICKSKALDFGTQFEANNPEEIIFNENIDTVFICTPNNLNQPLTIKALKAGKHVFCEKPPAFNSREVSEIQTVESSNGSKLMYGFNHRHHDSVKKIKNIVESDELGKILWMRGRYGKEVGQDFFNGWRADPKLSGGGILIDQGIHMLDLMLYLGEDFDEVQSMVSNLFWKQKGVEDNVFVNLRNNKNGICASVHSTMTQWRYLFSLEVFLEGGSLILNGLKTSSGAYGDEKLSIKRNQSHLIDNENTSEEHIVFHSDNSWISEIQHFVSSIEKNKSISIGSSEDALKVMRIIDKIYDR